MALFNVKKKYSFDLLFTFLVVMEKIQNSISTLSYISRPTSIWLALDFLCPINFAKLRIYRIYRAMIWGYIIFFGMEYGSQMCEKSASIKLRPPPYFSDKNSTNSAPIHLTL